MGMIKASMILVIGLVVLVAMLPMFNAFVFEIGTTLSSTVVLLCGSMVLLIVVVLILQLIQQFNEKDLSIGGRYD